MNHFYSPSTGGFYGEDVHGPRQIDIDGEAVPNSACLIPVDAVAVSDENWRALLLATSEGKQLAIVEGIVVAIDPAGEQD